MEQGLYVELALNEGPVLDGERTGNGELVSGIELVLDQDFIALNGQFYKLRPCNRQGTETQWRIRTSGRARA